MPLVPYVSPQAFKAHPTYLDLDGLRVGTASADDQTAELNNVLLKASAWADNEVNMPLAAHRHTQQRRARVDRDGNLKIHADHAPVLAVSSVGYGPTPTALTTMTTPTYWVEDDANIVVPLSGASVAWSGALQFGSPAASSEVFCRMIYTAGWVATRLTAASSAGATSLTVADPTGIVPGGSYRIWEPGVEETVTVSEAWTPPAATVPPTAAVVTLAQPTLYAHQVGHDFSGMPADMREAVINRTIAGLMRPDTSAEDSYPDTALSSNTRKDDPRQRATGLVKDACRTLASYARVR